MAQGTRTGGYYTHAESATDHRELRDAPRASLQLPDRKLSRLVATGVAAVRCFHRCGDAWERLGDHVLLRLHRRDQRPLLTWTKNSSGSLTGSASELQDLSPGNPNYIASTLAWTGTQTGRQLTITIPGDVISATLQGATLLRQEFDSQTGAEVTEIWVAGTRQDFETLLTAFRAYTDLGQDLQGLTFELQTARHFPNPSLSAQVRRYLDDAESRLATLRALRLPGLPGLRIPWIIPASRIDGTISAAEEFLAAAGTPPGATTPRGLGQISGKRRRIAFACTTVR